MDPLDWIGPWRLDPTRTELAFHSPTFWGFAHVKGVFTDIEGAAEAVADSNVTGHLTIAAASVNTGIGRRGKHLRSAVFFDVERLPTIRCDIHRVTAPREIVL